MNIIHEKTFDIAWGDMDALGHVNNVRYFDYFQEARIEWLAALRLDMNQETGPILLHIEATYLKPVVYPATLTLKSYLSHIGNSSLHMNHEIFQNNELVTTGLCKIVWVNYSASKSVPLPDCIKNLKV